MVDRAVLVPLAFALAVCGMLPFARCQARPGISSVYLAHEDSRWCSYRNEASWREAVSITHASEVGEITFANDQAPSTVKVTTEAESGDWIVYDQYAIGGDEKLISLTREVRIAQGDVRVREIYAFANGKAARTLQARVGPSGAVDRGRVPPDLPQLPIVTTFEGFPFRPLLNRISLHGAARKCVPDKPPQGRREDQLTGADPSRGSMSPRNVMAPVAQPAAKLRAC